MTTRSRTLIGLLLLALASSACGGGGGSKGGDDTGGPGSGDTGGDGGDGDTGDPGGDDSPPTAVIDVSHDGTGGFTFGLTAPNQFRRYQTFVAESHPTLTGVEVKIRRNSSTQHYSSVSVELYEADAEHRPATLLAMSAQSIEDLSGAYAVLTVPLTYHGLVSGKEYAVVLEQYGAYGVNDGFEWCTKEVSPDLHYGKQENGVWIDESGLGDGWLRVHVDDSAGTDPVPGTLDEGFGTGGVVTVMDGTWATAIAVQPDGRIVVGGQANDTSSGSLLLRLEADGSPDTTFGNGESIFTSIGDSFEITGIAIQPDGKIVAVGTSLLAMVDRMVLARFNQDGSPDTSFNSSGTVTTLIGTRSPAHAVALQPDGKIVIAGASTVAGSTSLTIARYEVGGTLDTTFNGSGWARASFGAGWHGSATSVVIQPDGRIVAAGVATSDSREYPAAIARFEQGGAPDTSFNGTGVWIASPETEPSRGQALVLQPDGRLVVAGDLDREFALTRRTRDGALDSTFHETGVATIPLGRSSAAYAAAIQPDGKIVAAGERWSDTDVNSFVVARYGADGQLDTLFNETGTAYGSIEGGGAFGLAIQPDGKIVAVGSGVRQGIRIVRYHP